MRLIQLAELLHAELKGDAAEHEVSGVASAKSATPESIVFATGTMTAAASEPSAS